MKPISVEHSGESIDQRSIAELFVYLEINENIC